MPAPGAAVGTELDEALPASVLDIPLEDSGGRTVRLRQFRGEVVVISDMMTLCQETCPMDTATVVRTARDENAHGGASGVVYLSVTVDPARDTPEQLHAYRGLFDQAPTNWLLLTGRTSDVARLWKFLGVWHQQVAEGPGVLPRNWRTDAALTYDVSHSDEVFFLDKRGRERFVLEGPPSVSPTLLPRTLRGFLNAQGRRDLASPSSSDWDESQARQVLAWLLS
jgi:protein SCO1/2